MEKNTQRKLIMKSFKIFSDRHHSSLTRSLQILFEERLGYELYTPIGIEWFDNGYWAIGNPYPNPRDTALQYLDMRGGEYKRNSNLNGDFRTVNGTREVYDPDHKVWLKTVTFSEFQKEKFDILIASYIDHIIPYWKLIQVYQPRAKLIHHAGNNWVSQIDWSVAKNVMASTAPFPYPSDKNVVFYHQEIDYKLFTYEKSYVPNAVMSFVNVLGGKDLRMFLDLEKQLHGFSFFAYGASCRNGSLPVAGHAEKLKQTQFVFHWKEGGDGFGHSLFTAFACGKPPIVNKNQYRKQLAEKLMQDGVTCIDIGNLSATDAAKKILEFSHKDKYKEMSEAAYKRFCEVVDYNKEEDEIRKFLAKLK